MGWDYAPKSKKSAAELAIADLSDWPKHKILASAIEKPQFPGDYSRVLYLAVKNESGVFGVVVLLDDGGNGPGYKVMSECMGPCEAACPARILDLLSPIASEWANKWRAKCRLAAPAGRGQMDLLAAAGVA